MDRDKIPRSPKAAAHLERKQYLRDQAKAARSWEPVGSFETPSQQGKVSRGSTPLPNVVCDLRQDEIAVPGKSSAPHCYLCFCAELHRSLRAVSGLASGSAPAVITPGAVYLPALPARDLPSAVRTQVMRQRENALKRLRRQSASQPYVVSTGEPAGVSRGTNSQSRFTTQPVRNN